MKVNRRSDEKGFTLIELVMVIVILGILAAVAIPRFIDIQSEARLASANGVAGAITGAASMLHAQYLIRGTNYTVGSAPAPCTTSEEILCDAGISGGASASGSALVEAAVGGDALIMITVSGSPYTLTVTMNSITGPRFLYNF